MTPDFAGRELPDRRGVNASECPCDSDHRRQAFDEFSVSGAVLVLQGAPSLLTDVVCSGPPRWPPAQPPANGPRHHVPAEVHGLRKDTRPKAARRLPGAPSARPGHARCKRRDAGYYHQPFFGRGRFGPAAYKSRPLGSIGGSGPRRLGSCAVVGCTDEARSPRRSIGNRASRGPLPEMRKGFFPF